MSTTPTDIPACRVCLIELTERPPASPEQAWCGTWFVHPDIQGLPPGAFMGHIGSALMPSKDLGASLAAQASSKERHRG